MIKTTFDPKLHGYQFRNGSPLPPELMAAAAAGVFFTFGLEASIAAEVGLGISALGVCGGMSWSALDFYHYTRERAPGYDNDSFPAKVLVTGTRLQAGGSYLYDYVWRRQKDSVSANLGGFLLAASRAPDTTGQYNRVKALLNLGQPVPLALPARSNLVWEGHHVVAFDYQEVGGKREVIIYDCNYPDCPMLLRIHADDEVEELFASLDATSGHWVEVSSRPLPRWKGYWIADGYLPQAPPLDLDDVVLVSDIAAAPASSTAPFKIGFTIANVGEFSTLVHSIGVLVDGQPTSNRTLVPGGRLVVSQTFAGELKVGPLGAGTHDIQPVYFTREGDPPRTLGTRRKVAVSLGFTAASWLEVGSLNPGPSVAVSWGALLSGPSLLNPLAPRVYEVKEYRIAMKVRVVDDLYGGGTFSPPVVALSASLDKGTLLNVKTTFDTHSATLEATYAPVPGAASTLLSLMVEDSNGAVLETVLSVPTSEKVTIPHIDLNRPVPDLRHDPFGRPALLPLPPRTLY
ncbi:MAG: hypothetical protein ABMB14_08775 [Myxococcota bacterium]